MFEAAELGQQISKEEFKRRVPRLRTQLLDVQRQLTGARFPVIVVFAGVDAAGKGETVNLLNEWMDPRWILTRAYGEPSDEERQRPEYWRYWRDLPPKGRVGLFLSAWYSRPILDRVYRRSRNADFNRELDQIAAFERTLADDGALILKFWMHLGRNAQKKRLRKLEADPLTRWRVTKTQWQHWRLYDRFVEAAELALQRTSVERAPWTIVEGADEAYRSLAVATTIRDEIRKALAEGRGERQPARGATAGKAARRKRTDAAGPTNGIPGTADGSVGSATILNSLDMAQSLAKEDFSRQLEVWQGRLNKLQRRAEGKGVSAILLFEGWDAAGKGGAIRRVTGALDARAYQVMPVAAPTDEERAQHYLWRFWRHLSRAGRLTIFDRSWYGRVLVERVEGFATESEWRRAYSEINEFEHELVESGIVLVKYWMHITKDEQERRFNERAKSPYKSWKLTEEDWRNREKWDFYELAVNDMVEHTSTHHAPWHLIPANDKNHARVAVLRAVNDAIERAL